MKSFKEFLQENIQCDTDKPVTKQELDKVEQQLDALWSMLNMDIEFPRHFFDRLNDARNKKQITACDVFDTLQNLFHRYGKKISNKVFKIKTGKDFEAVVKNINSNINIPFALEFDRRQNKLILINKTIMRKKGFKSPDPVYKVGK